MSILYLQWSFKLLVGDSHTYAFLYMYFYNMRLGANKTVHIQWIHILIELISLVHRGGDHHYEACLSVHNTALSTVEIT